MHEKYKRLQELHEAAQFDFPWYKGEQGTVWIQEFANEAHDIIPLLFERIEKLEEALKNSSCPSCGYAWEAKLWLKNQDG